MHTDWDRIIFLKKKVFLWSQRKLWCYTLQAHLQGWALPFQLQSRYIPLVLITLILSIERKSFKRLIQLNLRMLNLP